MNLCGIVKHFMNDTTEEVDHIKATTITVYME